jgi:hypothetical protein
VCPLDLSASETFFEVKVESDQGEHDRDWLGRFVSVLGGVGIDDELMDERGVGMRQGVEGEFVVEIVVARRRAPL